MSPLCPLKLKVRDTGWEGTLLSGFRKTVRVSELCSWSMYTGRFSLKSEKIWTKMLSCSFRDWLPSIIFLEFVLWCFSMFWVFLAEQGSVFLDMMLHYTLLMKARKNSSEPTQSSKTEEMKILTRKKNKNKKKSHDRKSEFFPETNAVFRLDFTVQMPPFL